MEIIHTGNMSLENLCETLDLEFRHCHLCCDESECDDCDVLGADDCLMR